MDPRPIALIIGTSQGIGRRTAEMLAERGYRLAVNDLREPRDLLDALALPASDAISITGDVSDDASVREMANTVEQSFGQVDVLVNKAGISFNGCTLRRPLASGMRRKRRLSFPLLAACDRIQAMNNTLTRTICCKLDVDGHDAALAATQRAFNQAATWVAQVCWDEGITNTNTAHHRVYGETRGQFGLGAQLAVCARAKAVEAIKAVKAKRRETCPTFGPRGSIRYDARTYRLMSLDRVSLNALEGRVVCRLLLGARQHSILVDSAWEVGGADLVWRAGVYYLHVTQTREAPPVQEPTGGTLGVDLGIINLATDSEGEHFTGRVIPIVQGRYHLRRQRLQKVNTKSSKRRLRQMRRREARFQSDTNHCISKRLVQKAVVSCKAIALEDLSGIRERTTVRHEHRYARHAWAFSQLRHYITYKAAQAGVPVRLVDPRNTSRTCSACGHCEKANRKSQQSFLCQRCGFTLNADHNAAINISRKERAAVNRPLAAPLAG
jgi:IS605 OrfB family transposase